ncbi:neutral zinc metallopeptidase [Actinophytocola sediminis]
MPLLSLAVLSVSACTTSVAGEPVGTGSVVTNPEPGKPGGVDPSFIENTDGGEIDQLAAAVLTDVRAYWTETFPATFDGQEWADLEGGYFSVDTAAADAPSPPCVEQAADVEGNAFYCPSEDIIAWDRAALLPVLKERFGDASVMLVLAHEMGHAVQRRAGVTVEKQRTDPERYPTILIEAQADCYAGSFVRWVVEDNAEHLSIAEDRLDSALESLITFRDPIGTEPTDAGAHGDAFDRVSAFQDGYDSGAQLCADISVDNRRFTQRGFRAADDAERGGNLPFEDLVANMTDDLGGYFNTVVTGQGGKWTAPSLVPVDGEPECDGDQGPIAFCAEGDEIEISADGELPELHQQVGDYATGIILASRYGMAALDALAKPLEGEQTQRQLLCLAGSYTGVLLDRTSGFTLSPGDLDEAIQVLLRYDYPGRDGAGGAIQTGYERVSVFRVGTLEGVEACELS